jgi:hypothetical protein
MVKGAVYDLDAIIDLDVATICPSQLLKSPPKRGKSRRRFRVTAGNVSGLVFEKYRNPPYALRLLRARRKRPGGRTTENREEIAPFHNQPSGLGAECHIVN